MKFILRNQETRKEHELLIEYNDRFWKIAARRIERFPLTWS